ncbi:MAG TPA: cytochrome c peroxidase [Candidatus Eisenbacteria bacterium]
MRRALAAFVTILCALELISVAGSAQVVPHVIKATPPSLKTVPIPTPVGIETFVKDKAAAVALGKALFWDMQVGSDGIVACASCHFQAGADRREKNELNPGANAKFDLTGPNHTYTAADFPFHQLANPDDRGSTLLRSRDDVSGSQGVHSADFLDIVLGGSRDRLNSDGLDGLGFAVSGLNVRRVTGRNTPSAINAVYNIRNFWDGRANRRFNGRNPFGDADPNARVLQVNDLGDLQKVHVSIDRASLASQAVGPPMSDVEMSGTGRTWMKLGKKMLSLTPLALQEVKRDDSVLGGLAVSGGKGLTRSYADMIRAAFLSKWWDSKKVVDGALNVLPKVTVPKDGRSLPTDQYTLMEANFSLFWGLAIDAYESTLVSDDAPYDRFQEGSASALTPQQKFGLLVFLGKAGGNCIACHFGAEFTGATFNTRLTPEGPGGPIIGVMERMLMGDGTNAVYDGGFYNLGIRPTGEDLGLGANDPFGNPLSFARQEQLHPGTVADNFLLSPIAPGERIAANGAFKTPSLRNCELTGPYFHNGSIASLSDVVDFYARGGNFREQNMADLDFEMIRQMGLIGHPNREIALADFLRSLTDERVRWNRAPFDHPELVVANGSSGGEVSVLQDLRVGSQASDVLERIPANGRGGATAPLRSFLNLPVFDGKPVDAPNPVYSNIALYATDTVTVATSADVTGDVWCSGPVRVSSAAKHTFTGDITAGGSVTVTGDSTLFQGSIMARGPVSLAPTTSFKNGVAGGNVEYYAPMPQQALPDLPVLPLIKKMVVVPRSSIQTLSPGRYGEVTVQNGAWLVLMNGVYVFKSLQVGAGAFLQYDADGQLDMPAGPLGEMTIRPLERTTIHVTDVLTLSPGAIVSQGDAMLSTHLRIYFRGTGSGVQLPQNSFFHGTLIAPLTSVSLGSLANTQGAIYAKSVSVAEGAVFRPHILPILAPLPGAGGGGIGGLVAGPVNPDDRGPAGRTSGLVFSLGQSSPNPFRSGQLSTTIRFTLPTDRDVELRVFDVAGRSVKVLAKGRMAPGTHALEWNGAGERGGRVPSGVYFYRLLAGNDHAQGKMVLID